MVDIVVLETPPALAGGPTVGSKRNTLLELARGLGATFVSFVDDDDVVTDDYVQCIYGAINCNDVDLVCFDVTVYGHGDTAAPCLYRTEYELDFSVPGFYYRLPNHLMVWRLDRCLPFEDVNKGEDGDWAKRMMQAHGKMRTAIILGCLYEYHWNRADSASAGNAR